MNLILLKKLLFTALFLAATIGCQTQTGTDSADRVDSNTVVKDSKAATKSGAELAAPQTIKFESVDKVEIVGTFYESLKPDSPALLLLHQWNSNRKSYNKFAKRMQGNGYSVLSIDGRGFGESVKTKDGKTVGPARTVETVKSMTLDVGNAFEFLAEQKSVDGARIGIIGASYGSSLALIYGAENPKAKAVALLSPGLNYFGSMPTEPAIKSFGNRPLLLVAAEDDRAATNSVKRLKNVGGNAKYEVEIYPKGGHGTALFAARVGLEDLLEEFLEKNL
jgi:dienelactone hydrolase